MVARGLSTEGLWKWFWKTRYWACSVMGIDAVSDERMPAYKDYKPAISGRM
jgi:hypothetical protein